METVVIVIHLMVVLALVVIVLLQRSEGGALGIGGGGGLMSSRGTANALTRLTAILAAGFFVTSLALGILAGVGKKGPSTILDSTQQRAPGAPALPGAPTGGGSILDQLQQLQNQSSGEAPKVAPAAEAPKPEAAPQPVAPAAEAPKPEAAPQPAPAPVEPPKPATP